MHANEGKPADSSVLRKNIGTAILNMRGGKYTQYIHIWRRDFIRKNVQSALSHIRDIELEKEIEKEINLALEERFYFRIIVLESRSIADFLKRKNFFYVLQMK